MSALSAKGDTFRIFSPRAGRTVKDRQKTLRLATEQRDRILDILREMHPEEMNILKLCEQVIEDHTEADGNGAGAEKSTSTTTPPNHRADRDYSEYVYALDAIRAYLENHGPTARRLVPAGLVRNGWGSFQRSKNTQDLIKDLQSAITYQLYRASSPTIAMRENDSVLYLVETPDDPTES